MSVPLSAGPQAIALLSELGAETLDHPGGTLLAHLRRVQEQLATWGARPACNWRACATRSMAPTAFPRPSCRSTGAPSWRR